MIIIMGVKHSGKSTLGKIAADRLNEPFLDLDRELERLYRENHRRMLSFREIYNQRGPEVFRLWETRAAEELAAGRREQGILSLGGGTIENPGAFAPLKREFPAIYLACEAETLFKRIETRGLPRFLETENPRKTFRELYERRDSLYRQHADLILDLEDQPIEASADQLMEAIEKLRKTEA